MGVNKDVWEKEVDLASYYEECAATYENIKVLGVYEKSYLVFQRFMDIVLSCIGLIIGIPIIMIFGLAIIIETPGPIIYTQKRVGKEGKIFTIYKLRSMTLDAEKAGPQWAKQGDCRVTRVGRFIRKTRIDEIPQLFNVLKGDMSIIGPRPERPMFTVRFNEEIPGSIERLQVKPGLTGWAQINGGYEITPREKLKLDLYYIENRNIRMDLVILFKTVKVVLTGEGAR